MASSNSDPELKNAVDRHAVDRTHSLQKPAVDHSPDADPLGWNQNTHYVLHRFGGVSRNFRIYTLDFAAESFGVGRA